MMGDGDDDALYNLCQRKKQKQNPKRRISQNLLSNFLNKEDISVWGPYDCSNFYILSVIIQWVLDEFVFGREYSVGIIEDQVRILKDVSRGMWHAKSKLEPSGLIIGLFSPHLSLVPRYVLILKASSPKQPLRMHTAAPLVLNSILPYTRSLLPRSLFSLPTFPHCSLAATACFYLATFYLFAISFGYCT